MRLQSKVLSYSRFSKQTADFCVPDLTSSGDVGTMGLVNVMSRGGWRSGSAPNISICDLLCYGLDMSLVPRSTICPPLY